MSKNVPCPAWYWSPRDKEAFVVNCRAAPFRMRVFTGRRALQASTPMRPALYHEHDPEFWPGEQDAHGKRIGPRYGQFQRDAPGPTFFARLSASQLRWPEENAWFEFKVASPEHFVWYTAADGPPPTRTSVAVMWWRRPRQTTRVARAPYEFPWDLDARITLTDRPGSGSQVKAEVLLRTIGGGAQAKAATGYVICDVTWLDESDAAVVRAFTEAWQRR